MRESSSAPAPPMPFQFGLRTVFALVAIAAFYLAMWRHLGRGALFAAFLFALSLLTLCNKRQGRPQRMAAFWTGVASMQFAYWCFAAIYWTDGEVAVFAFAIFAFLPAAAATLFLWFIQAHRIACIASLMLLACFLFRQAPLVYRLHCLEAEVRAAGDYVERHAALHGDYPADLSSYRFRRSEFQSLVTYWPPDGSYGYGWNISYDLFEGDNTNRDYGPSGWYYYPD